MGKLLKGEEGKDGVRIQGCVIQRRIENREKRLQLRPGLSFCRRGRIDPPYWRRHTFPWQPNHFPSYYIYIFF